MTARSFLKISCLVFCLTAGAAVTPAQRSNLRIDGTVVGISGRLAGRTLPFRLIVNNYTSGGQISELNSALDRSEDELLKTLSKMNAGRIQIGNNVGVEANAIIAVPWENGTKITVIYQRNINFFELRYGVRSADYRFGYAELFLDRNGHGEGTFIPAARVRSRNGQWEVEDFGVLPARLLGLRANGSVTPR